MPANADTWQGAEILGRQLGNTLVIVGLRKSELQERRGESVNSRFYNAFRTVKKLDYMKVCPCTQLAFKLQKGRMVYACVNLISFQIRIYPATEPYFLFRDRFFFNANCDTLSLSVEPFGRDWIDIHEMSKVKVPDGQKQAYLTYTRANNIKISGSRPYPVIDIHDHNRAHRFECSDEEIETATCVMEAVADYLTDKTKYGMHSNSERDIGMRDSRSREIICIDCTDETRPVSIIQMTDQIMKLPRPLPEPVRGKVSQVLKLPRAGKVQIMAEYPNWIYHFAFDEDGVVPTIFAIGDDKMKALPVATCTLTDYVAERETVWETILDFIIRRGKCPDVIECCGTSMVTLANLCRDFAKRLGAAYEPSKKEVDPLCDAIEEVFDDLEDREAKGKERYYQENILCKQKSYVFRITLKGGRYWDGETVIREICMDQENTFGDLHMEIQAAFDLDNDHGFLFKQLKLGDGEIGGFPISDETFDDVPNAWNVYFYEANIMKGDKFSYIFDMGDWWVFEIKVKQVLDERTAKSRLIYSEGDNPEQYPSWD